VLAPDIPRLPIENLRCTFHVEAPAAVDAPFRTAARANVLRGEIVPYFPVKEVATGGALVTLAATIREAFDPGYLVGLPFLLALGVFLEHRRTRQRLTLHVDDETVRVTFAGKERRIATRDLAAIEHTKGLIELVCHDGTRWPLAELGIKPANQTADAIARHLGIPARLS